MMNRPSDKHKLYSVYHQHAYGSSHYLLWSEIFPNENQVVEALQIDFEPEEDEFIDLGEVDGIQVLSLS